jgi:hypothetical protein
VTCAQTPRDDTYWVCPHNPRDPRHALRNPDHPPRVSVREDHLTPAISEFCDTYLFGPHRARHLAKLMPASAATAAARRDKKITALQARLRQIDAAEDAHAREIEQLTREADPTGRAVTALRKRILARFNELEEERDKVTQQLADLSRQQEETSQDPSLLDALPLLTPERLASAPEHLLAQLYQALDLQLLYNKDDDQVTIHAVLTDTTPDDIAAILATLRDPSHAAGQDSDPVGPAGTGPTAATPKVSVGRPITRSSFRFDGGPDVVSRIIAQCSFPTARVSTRSERTAPMRAEAMDNTIWRTMQSHASTAEVPRQAARARRPGNSDCYDSAAAESLNSHYGMGPLA